MMTQVMTLAFLALIIALVTIVLGTYFVFHSILIFVLDLFEAQRQYRLEEIEQFYPVTAKFPYPRLYADIIYGSDAFCASVRSDHCGTRIPQ